MNNYTPITYSDLLIKPLDLEFINRICEHRDCDIDDIDLGEMLYYHFSGRYGRLDITNYIISEIFHNSVFKYVEDEDDSEKLRDSIYVNCFDSGFSIKPSELKTKQAIDFLEDFNNRNID